jgi:hypothetical protein
MVESFILSKFHLQTHLETCNLQVSVNSYVASNLEAKSYARPFTDQSLTVTAF